MSTAMKINDREISRSELIKEWDLVKQKCLKDSTLPQKEIENTTLIYAKNNIITRVLIEQLANEISEEVKFSEIQSEYKKMIDHFGGKEKFLLHFSNLDLNEFKIKENIEKSIRVNHLIDRWKQAGAALLSEEEIMVHYEENREKYGTEGGTLTIYFMLPQSGDEESKSMSQLQQSYENFLTHHDEANFFRAVKNIPSLKIKQHVLIENDFLPPELEEVLLSIDDGHYTGLIKDQNAVHLFKKIKTVKPKLFSYEEVKQQVKKEVSTIKQNNYIKTQVAQLRKKANIEDYYSL